MRLVMWKKYKNFMNFAATKAWQSITRKGYPPLAVI